MLNFFRSTQAYAGLPFLLYAAVLQLPVFFGGSAAGAVEVGYGVAGNQVAAWAQAHPWLAIILPVPLMALLALQATVLSNRHQFTRSATQLSALGVLLVWGLVPNFRLLHPGMLANIFLLFAMLSVGRVYKNPYPEVPIFNCGAWLAVASFFSPAYLLFFVPFYIASATLGRGGFTEVLRLLTGIGSIYFLAATGAYFIGALPEFYAAQMPRLSFSLGAATGFEATFVGILSVLSLVMVLQKNNIVRIINIEGAKGVDMLYTLLIFTPGIVLFTSGIAVKDAFTLIVPLGILLGLTLHNLPERPAELVHLFLVVGVLLVGSMALLFPLG